MALALLSFVLTLATQILPFIIIGLVAYVLYSYVRRDREQKRGSITVEDDEQAVAVRPARRRRSSSTSTVTPSVTVVEAPATKTVSASAPQPDETDIAVTTSIDVEDEVPHRLRVEQDINPDTGIAEPNMTRLMELERDQALEAEQQMDQIQKQLEERRRRLLSGDDK